MRDEPPRARSVVPFPLQELVPVELRGVLCDFVWDVDKLQRLPLPIDAATVDSLSRNDRWVILDGVHRLLKADLLGLSTIQVRRLPAAMLPLIHQLAT
jgi:hypothetical protein